VGDPDGSPNKFPDAERDQGESTERLLFVGITEKCAERNARPVDSRDRGDEIGGYAACSPEMLHTAGAKLNPAGDGRTGTAQHMTKASVSVQAHSARQLARHGRRRRTDNARRNSAETP
jgi:hypothetical protein